MSPITVRKVQTRAEHRVFFEFPYHLYKDSPYWVPPLKSSRRKLLDQHKDPAWQYMEGDYFIAWRDQTPVGTIAAFVNHRHNQRWHENIAWFGAFDFVDDVDVAMALLQTAESWAKERGYTALRGPATFTLHSEVGVLMRPFDRPPLILMPYNYDYYPHHIEAAGYGKIKDLLTYCTDLQDVLGAENFAKRRDQSKRIAQRIMQREGITYRRGNPRNKKADYEFIRQVYAEGWYDNWGFIELTDQEFEHLVQELQLVYDPKMAFFVSVKGKPAAFVVGTPDLNQALHWARPSLREPEFLTLLKALWFWKVRRKVTTLRFALAGISREFHGSGVIAVLAHAWFEVFADPNLSWKHYDGGWVLEDNEKMNLFLEKSLVNACRLYRIYQKTL
ncbi:MAG: hypothetical protein CUN55_03100 [Phototrophicales bacterium]|nr:MAG: hypothetical protein CUN55_03100 [Phototrophicales bacterium]